jgi:hypothetical protein
MNPYTEKPLQTLPEWNAVLAAGCCCEMPECPVPEAFHQYHTGSLCGVAVEGNADGLNGILFRSLEFTGTYATDTGWYDTGNSGIDDEFRDTRSKELTFTLERQHETTFETGSCGTLRYTAGSYVFSETFESRNVTPEDYNWTETTTAAPDETQSAIWPGSIEIAPGAVGFPRDPDDYPLETFVNVDFGFGWPDAEEGSWADAGSTITWTPSSFPGYDFVEATYTGAYTTTTARAALENPPPPYNGTEAPGPPSAYYSATKVEPGDDRLTAAAIRYARHGWSVPTIHLGTWYKVVWDILEEPVGWDTPGSQLSRSFTQKDQTWEWTGPGNPALPASWKSGFYTIDPPQIPGTRRPVNGRAWCYRSPYGTLPTPFGEQVPRLDGENEGALITGTLDFGALPL